ncbi:hypothetical protein EJ04DRAFT_560503 [Polyplosphaeria fusca]|uniref:Lipocalin-like domain-containing protein n=1 Tax=Polyplosphaeria fusca TaxID=682080 RepID=A0A9P4V5K6_9PLEO|nr:hypothetical protein EJ04DRAFT_560503 [Polyplosphaeria fusca]
MVAPTDILTLIYGTWLLVEQNGTSNKLGRGTSRYPIGLLTYTPTNYMSANIMASEPEFRPSWLQYPNELSDSDTDWAQVGKHTLSYAGPFSLVAMSPGSNTSGQLIHGPLTMANVPSWVGTEQSRNFKYYELGGDTWLKITSGNSTGANNTGLFWKKIT